MTRNLFDTVPARALGRKERDHHPPTLRELEQARRAVAQIVIKFGEVYLPVFRRLDDECVAAREKDDVIGRVRRIASTTSAA